MMHLFEVVHTIPDCCLRVCTFAYFIHFCTKQRLKLNLFRSICFLSIGINVFDPNKRLLAGFQIAFLSENPERHSLGAAHAVGGISRKKLRI